MSESAVDHHAAGYKPKWEGFIARHSKIILFTSFALCLAGLYAAQHMPASVFPETDFPRVVILVDNGVMPADEMMATITRPIEEAMNDIPGTVNIRSATGRGSAEINVFFTWRTDMVQAELYVLSRMSQIRSTLPDTAEFQTHRLTFMAFPIIGISLTSQTRGLTDLWEIANYDIKPRLLRIEGVARVDLVGGREPEYHVVVDPAKLAAHNLNVTQVSQALADTNLFTSAGMHEESRQLYLTLVDGRVKSAEEIGDIPVAWSGGAPVYVRDIATVEPGEAPQYNIVTADGVDAVLLNIRSQPDGNTVGIANALQREIQNLRNELPPDMRLAFFYDQSLFVREGVRSVWESIIFGLMLSVTVLFLFLRNIRTTFVAVLAIPATLLITLGAMSAAHMSFNLMTLGGIAAAIGLIIDDAIVVVEAIHAKINAGYKPAEAVHLAMREVGMALVGSTITPVAVFIPLAFLDGVPGVFFRALALTMVCSLLVSLLLAVTMTPTLAAYLLKPHRQNSREDEEQGGRVLRRIIALYESAVRYALRHTVKMAGCIAVVILLGVFLYGRLDSDFLPAQDEGAFVLDYFSRPGTSLSETDRMLRHVEQILQGTPEVESYSRRTGARLALAIAEPNTGDFLVKLRPDRARSTEEVIDELREKVQAAEPALNTEFPGVLSDLIGDLTWSPEPVEIKIYSNDTEIQKRLATQIASEIQSVPGVVDVNDGLVVAGPSLVFRVKAVQALRAGLDAAQLGSDLETSLLGTVSSHILEGDRIRNVRVLLANTKSMGEDGLGSLHVRAAGSESVSMSDVTTTEHEPGLLEMERDDQRQLVAVSARLAGVDLRSGITAIKQKLADALKIPLGVSIEYGGLFQQQQESFANLTRVLLMAVLLVFAILIAEFRALLQPIAIVVGAVLALFGVIAALWSTGISLNIVSFLSTIIGFGIVAKNGILMLDYVDQLRERGLTFTEALVQSGRRRLRPVLMTSLTAFLGLLPLAYGVGAGADMLRPLAVGVIGALCMSLLLSLVATPVVYYILVRIFTPHVLRSSAAVQANPGSPS
ncbi:MAG: efflux RND transporter permease subunit [Candidatus Hydrogenedentes bacterium]|nr:efflux RND transporter permease subunit [Candidatus Hydrogenedentota bacterium]